MANYAPRRTTYDTGDRRWLPDMLKAETHGVTIDGDIAGTPGTLKSGTHIAVVTAAGATEGHAGRYAGTTEEVVTLTEGGSGLTSFTITFGGQTTSSLDDDATAAQVQAALEALSTIGEGNIEVTGGPLGTGPFTLRFVGDLADTNVGAVTTTPTGGTGTVVVAVATAGGAEAGTGGLDTSVGHLLNDLVVEAGKQYHVAVVHAGTVDRRYLPVDSQHDAAAEDDLTAIAYIH